ncbi:polysaccharide biosynthesis/export family protein [Prochlorococcus marinus]|uniref:polysaccharide biosynthesis/export family protein n=1 Tax=Prochlorococcus marinus TaxID=1219 RepID=UPI001ADA86A6|nr:polysaccharide biosynthesis/export family protein [Prochlorococcus marinus]MBO8217715.1 polysaccharide export protein [Prochlorococcus marinus XMU1405]MBW3040878.1 hypothetical protein [Prochlorococcus marinus str. MU1405]MBW3048338.1 hypothetical protein [Prochlorococcus marinus str. MU1406]
MKNKFLYCTFVFLFTLANNLNTPLVYSSTNTKDNQLTVDFLKISPINDYIIGPGDKLKIIISRDLPELNAAVQVDGEGSIYVPLLKRVYVNGLSINELNLLLNEAYLKFVKSPDVETTVLSYRPLRVFVEGEVVNPGLKTLRGSFSVGSGSGVESSDNLLLEENSSFQDNKIINQSDFFPTVFDAIRASGGITNYSDLEKIKIIRREKISEGGGKKITNLNFYDLLTKGDNSQNIRIYDSDLIKIGKTSLPQNQLLRKAISSSLNSRFVNVFVNGRVINPGLTKISRSGALNDAIDMAGGAKIVRGPITFVRFNNDGTVDKRKFSFRRNAKRGSYKNPYMKDGDFLYVGQNIFTSTSEVITEITNPFVGVFSTYGLIKAVSD